MGTLEGSQAAEAEDRDSRWLTGQTPSLPAAWTNNESMTDLTFEIDLP